MAYDLELADQLREVLATEPDVVEKRMFGGLAFMVAGHMAVCATQGGLMVRVEPKQTQELLTEPQASPMVMRGRELAGWLVVAVDASATGAELGRWVQLGVGYVRTLPPK